ncbi:MAG: 30S ribosomal protein S8 [Candidatus Aenigmarchaeota archaeon]|nr:30S ribosomal protein S8 [Candidatus Aenigmarchaeota archaeon]
MKHDPLADAFAVLKNAESIGRKECVVPATKVVKGMLKVIREKGYIAGFDFVEDGKGGFFKVKLAGRINNCNVIRPRFSVTTGEMIKWEKKFLPGENIGLLLMTTPKGITDQKDALKLNTGGKLLGFIF